MSKSDSPAVTNSTSQTVSTDDQQKAPFLLFVIDWDRQEFTIEGPMTDDTRWLRAVDDGRNTGRRISCFVLGEASVLKDQVASGWQTDFAHRFVSPGSIV
jgi:hypothetical protein